MREVLLRTKEKALFLPSGSSSSIFTPLEERPGFLVQHQAAVQVLVQEVEAVRAEETVVEVVLVGEEEGVDALAVR
jgi:hypothetical protein